MIFVNSSSLNVDWKSVSEAYNFAAVDANGSAYLYGAEPVISKNSLGWLPSDPCDIVTFLCDLKMSKVSKNYWRNSLVRRDCGSRRNTELLTIASFQEECRKTAVYPGKGTVQGLVYCALGLAEEAGECVGKIKKMLRDGDGVLTEEIIESIVLELGDVEWYQSTMADEIGRTRQYIMQKNVEKLSDRKARGAIGGSGDNR